MENELTFKDKCEIILNRLQLDCTKYELVMQSIPVDDNMIKIFIKIEEE